MSLVRPLRHLTALGVAGAVLATRTASAEPPALVTGAFLGFALGEPAGFLWGFDAHAYPFHNQRDTWRGGAFFRLSCAPGSKFDLATGVGLLLKGDRDTWAGADAGPSWRVGSAARGI